MAEREGPGSGVVSDPRGVLRQGRVFLDFFWDIARPEQEVRLAATENLLRHLREGRKVRRGSGLGMGPGGRRGCGFGRGHGGAPAGLAAGGARQPRGVRRSNGHRRSWGSVFQDDELKYTLKRLVEGLGATRKAARPGFSLALAQVSISQSRALSIPSPTPVSS